MTQSTSTPPSATKYFSTALIIFLSIAVGIVVASNYYAQPLLENIAQSFSLSVNQAGSIVTLAQLSYAFGLMFLVPLGDRFERRRLVVIMTLLSALGLVIVAMADTFELMLLGTALTGLFSVVAQVLIPFAASMSPIEKRGKVLGTMMTGLLLGILLARTVAGLLVPIAGWQTIYWLACGLLLIVALVLGIALPKEQRSSTLNYSQLLASIITLFSRTPILRQRAILGGLSFANFSMLWTSLAFLLAGKPYFYSEELIGLFGLVGAAGALGATLVGRWVDKGYAKQIISLGLLAIMLSWIPMGFGVISLSALIVGVLVLDFALQAVQIANQSVVYHLIPEARNRVTAGYMTSYFIGGSLGSVLSAYSYHLGLWPGVAIAGAAIGLLNLLLWFKWRKTATTL